VISKNINSLNRDEVFSEKVPGKKERAVIFKNVSAK
jgi:hypothetical protein